MEWPLEARRSLFQDWLWLWENSKWSSCQQIEIPAKIWTGMCRALLCGDDSSHSQSQSGKRLLLASRGHPIRTPAYHGSCIGPTHQAHTLDLTPDLPFPRSNVPIQLLIKDKFLIVCFFFHGENMTGTEIF